MGGQVGPKFRENPRSAGAFCRDFTEKKSPQCRAYTWALQMEKSISPLFPGPEGAVVANDWCMTLLHSKTGVRMGISLPIFLISVPKHRLWVLVRTASPIYNLCFGQKIRKRKKIIT